MLLGKINYSIGKTDKKIKGKNRIHIEGGL